ncbi:MAG: copper oxidase, partial [Nitrosopumilaceae archaeon]
MKYSQSQKMASILTVVAAISLFYFIFPSISDAQLEEKTFLTHSGAIVKTSGDILDPVYSAQTVDFDPEKFLREFNYGRVSKLPDGTTL